MLYRLWVLFYYAKGYWFCFSKQLNCLAVNWGLSFYNLCLHCLGLLSSSLSCRRICLPHGHVDQGSARDLDFYAQNLRFPFSGFLLPGSLHHFLVALAAQALYPQFLWPRQQLPITTTAIEIVMFYFRVKPQKMW